MKKLKKIRITLLFLLILNIFLINKLINNRELLSSQEESTENSIVYIVQLQKLTSVGRLTDEHLHADIKMFINGKDIDLNIRDLEAPEFGSLEFWKQNKVSKFTHLHEGTKNKGIVHVHATGITLGMFLTTIDAKINDTCLTLPKMISNSTYCGNDLNVYVNNQKISNPQHYIFQDLDQILINYGNHTPQELQEQLKSVGKLSCISSENCVKE